MKTLGCLVSIGVASVLLAGCVTEPTPPRPLTGRSGPSTVVRTPQAAAAAEPALGAQNPQVQFMSDLNERLAGLGGELRDLRNDSERNSHDLEDLRTRQRDMYLDLDRRLQTLEGGAGRKSSDSQAMTDFPRTSAPAPRPAAAPTPAPRPEPTPAATASTPAAAPSGGAVIDGGELTTYNDAFNQLKAGQYTSAISGFRRFLSAYPQSAYAGNAQYWLAEANYVNKDYPTAVSEFSRVIQTFPQSSKVPDAKLKLGFAYSEMGDWAKARSTLEDVRSRYPGSTVARLADQRLTRMSQEGH